MSFFDAVASAFKQYFILSGRASRSEFWWFILFLFSLYLLTFNLMLNEIGGASSFNEEEFLSNFWTSWFGLAIIFTTIPSITIAVRRFHDINMSGWWYVALQIVPNILGQYVTVFILISFITLFVFLYFMCVMGGDENQYGTNPLYNKE